MYLSLSGDKIELSDIEDIESSYSIKLPNSYKDFLLLNNGGIIKIEDSRFGDTIFFGVNVAYRNLSWEIHENKKKGFIPVGENLNLDYLYISSNTNEVVFNDEVVAKSFGDFINDFLIK